METSEIMLKVQLVEQLKSSEDSNKMPLYFKIMEVAII